MSSVRNDFSPDTPFYSKNINKLVNESFHEIHPRAHTPAIFVIGHGPGIKDDSHVTLKKGKSLVIDNFSSISKILDQDSYFNHQDQLVCFYFIGAQLY